MGLTKINQILKKYRILNEKHKKSWDEAQKRIRANWGDNMLPDEKVYMAESYKYHVEGNRLFDAMINELDGHEIFPKHQKKQIDEDFLSMVISIIEEDEKKYCFHRKDEIRLIKSMKALLKGEKTKEEFLEEVYC